MRTRVGSGEGKGVRVASYGLNADTSAPCEQRIARNLIKKAAHTSNNVASKSSGGVVFISVKA